MDRGPVETQSRIWSARRPIGSQNRIDKYNAFGVWRTGPRVGAALANEDGQLAPTVDGNAKTWAAFGPKLIRSLPRCAR
jgi:hypothetical protein